MDTFINSFLLVFAGEMGDKTQLLALMLTARYKKPGIILLGVLVATLLNHGFASWVGGIVASLMDPVVLKWGLALTFFAFALWILVPDKEEELTSTKAHSVFLATVIAFFLAEMGDKTQLATIALGARYNSEMGIVTLGTTLGMLASNALAIFFGERLLRKIPMKWVRIFTSFLFLVFGIAILFVN